MTTVEAFSQRLKALREKKGLTQDALARELGIGRAALGLYENGDRQPNIEILRRIAEHFNVSSDYLIGRGEGTPTIGWSAETMEHIAEAKKTVERTKNGALQLILGLQELISKLDEESEES